MSTQDTPTPLTIDFVRGTYVILGNHLPVAKVCRGPWALERAAHIVRCVNAHGSLVTALVTALARIADLTDDARDYSDDNEALHECINIARAALKAATEPQS